MDKQEFIKVVDNFCSNIELEYVSITGEIKKFYFEKLLKTTDIILNDLPFDSIEKMFNTVTEFWNITREYYTYIKMSVKKATTNPEYNYTVSYTDSKGTVWHDTMAITVKSNSSFISSSTSAKTLIYTKEAGGYFKTYDKRYVNNTYLRFNDYLFFKKYFNLDIEDIDLYYPVKIINKKEEDFNAVSNLFNIPIIAYKTLTTNNDNLIIKDNKFNSVYGNKGGILKKSEGNFYNNTFYNFYNGCSLFNVIKYFIYGLLQYKQEETHKYRDIPMEKTEILKISENIDITVSQNMINKINYDNMSEQELIEELQPIPTEDLYENEQHIILQGIFEDIQKFCNNLEKYIVGGNWYFDKINYDDLKNIDEKIDYLENVLKNYNNKKLDMSGYNSKYKAVKRDIIVGDSDNLNYLNLTESENNFLHIEKILQSNKYPLFAKLNLINQIKNTINIYLTTIKNISDNKGFYNEETTEVLLWDLRDSYDKLAKAVASQEQPLSFGNPSYDSNPNENPFRQELP